MTRNRIARKGGVHRGMSNSKLLRVLHSEPFESFTEPFEDVTMNYSPSVPSTPTFEIELNPSFIFPTSMECLQKLEDTLSKIPEDEITPEMSTAYEDFRNSIQWTKDGPSIDPNDLVPFFSTLHNGGDGFTLDYELFQPHEDQHGPIIVRNSSKNMDLFRLDPQFNHFSEYSIGDIHFATPFNIPSTIRPFN